MPAIRALSDFNRNQNAIIDELAASREPMYLTRNGKASVVVMDADAFDRAMSFREELRAREMKVYHGLLHGYQEALDGKTVPASEALQQIRQKKGWA